MRKSKPEGWLVRWTDPANARSRYRHNRCPSCWSPTLPTHKGWRICLRSAQFGAYENRDLVEHKMIDGDIRFRVLTLAGLSATIRELKHRRMI